MVPLVGRVVPSTTIGYALGEAFFGSGFVAALLTALLAELMWTGVLTSSAVAAQRLRARLNIAPSPMPQIWSTGRRFVAGSVIAIITAGLIALVWNLLLGAPEGKSAYAFWIPVVIVVILLAAVLALAAIEVFAAGERRLGGVALVSVGAQLGLAVVAGFIIGPLIEDVSRSLSITVISAVVFLVLQALNPLPWLAVARIKMQYLGGPRRSLKSTLHLVGRAAVVTATVVAASGTAAYFSVEGFHWGLGIDTPPFLAQLAGLVLGVAVGVVAGVVVGGLTFVSGIVIYPLAIALTFSACWALTRNASPPPPGAPPGPGGTAAGGALNGRAFVLLA